MKSNGFGRFEQTIIIRVDGEYAQHASNCLKSEPFRIVGDGHHDFIFKRLTTTRGDDEDIVYDVDAMLNLKFGTWSILWGESEY
ncbi:MAG: hypothetical protein NZ828_11940 [Alphaproteobacteria bacterium]|nr:hypothetical protein [Alphaproteobacteria bacterium]